jgi:hypothetical protein
MYQQFFEGFVGINSAIAETLYAEREMNVDNFSGIFSAFNCRLGDGEISIKDKKYLSCKQWQP